MRRKNTSRKRNAIKPKTDITEITKRVAEELECNQFDVKREIGYYWIDVDMMFTHCCGYAVYVEKFGTFWIYTAGIYGILLDIDKRIRKKVRTVEILKRLKIYGKATAVMAIIADLMTRVILLDYAVREYKDEVLAKYPKKYKVTHQDRYQTVIDGLVKLFGVPLAQFPITINYPVQEMYVRRLRRKGLLHNPVVSNIKTYRGQYKEDKNKEM